jgi:hypothetical protein
MGVERRVEILRAQKGKQFNRLKHWVLGFESVAAIFIAADHPDWALVSAFGASLTYLRLRRGVDELEDQIASLEKRIKNGD